MNELFGRLKELENILRSAGPLILEGFSRTPGMDESRTTKLSTTSKASPRDLVTFYDKAVEEHLYQKILKSFPGETIIGEEDTASRRKTPQELISLSSSKNFWVVDPIDGTTNFARAYPFFCTTAAFCEKTSAGWKVLAGAIYNPISDEMFGAALGQGATLNRSQIKVSPVKKPIHSLMATGFASQRSQNTELPFEIFSKITQQTLGVRRDGSAALDLAFVAAGRVDAYWEWGLSPWDTAAGSLLVSEAFGKVSDFSDKENGLFQGEILASNVFLHKWVLNRIKEIRNESA